MSWISDEVAKATGGVASGAWTAERVVTDSRAITAGDLFVALRGEHFDGHDFVAQALADGAAGAIVDRDYQGASGDKLIRVDDTLLALQALGGAGRSRSRAKVVGVTGSVGKTSCKDALHLVCSAQARSYATTGNLNNHIGLPLMLANMPEDTEIAILEMGMNHAGEIALLSRIARPDVAIITAVEAAHLEFFADVGEIADAKAEICAGMAKDGILVIPADSPHADRLRARAAEYGIADVQSFGSAASATHWLSDYRPHAEGSDLMVVGGRGERSLRLMTVGRHWAVMAVGVLTVAAAVGLDVELACESLSLFREPKGRGRAQPLTLPAGAVIVLDDSYNASPASMRAAFARLGEMRTAGHRGRAIAALGDMRELGEDAPDLHRQLAVDLVERKIDKLYAAGSMMRGLFDAIPSEMRGLWTEDASQLADVMASELESGDIILVKGSRGSRMDRLVTALEKAAEQGEKTDDAL